jgi:S1-C subfamily serine protease
MSRVTRLLFVLAVFVSIRSVAFAQQFADPEFDAKVDRPAFPDRHPLVLLDEAHNNFHTADGRYKPFADLLTNDGFEVKPNKEKFSSQSLKACTILVVANAQGAPLMRSPEAANSAFDAAECDAVGDWVRAGGSILLIADHHPWGASNEQLASRLGVEMGKSTTFDPANSETGLPAQLNFSRVNGLIGNHAILTGRDGSERVDRVLTFAGQSLKGPNSSVALLKLSKSAVDQPRPAVPGRKGTAAGRAQGLALTLGRGKAVVLGEAGMLSAQLNGRQGAPMGMNVPGTDNRQFALNIVHWLSGVKFPARVDVAARSKGAGAAKKSTSASKKSAAVEAGDVAKSSAMRADTATAPATTRRSEPERALSSAEIAAESEPSIAMITGDGSVGTGFLVRPGIIATNAHVIDDEFMTTLRVRFPSADKAQQGPMPTELVFEDSQRDLAFLRVKSALPPLRIADSYTFRKGEDVTVIGNPGAGGQLILENAISRGLMSTKTSLEGQRYYQLSIAVNPGNSGGPVFNSYGAVIGVVTRKSAAQEALAFCIPIEDLNLAIEKVVSFPEDATERQQSQHRVILAVKGLGGSGALYCTAINLRRQNAANGANPNTAGGFYDAAIDHLEKQTFPRLRAEVDRVRDDNLVSQPVRDGVGQLAENLERLKNLHADISARKSGKESLANVRATHRRLLIEVCKSIKLDVPGSILAALEDSPENGKDAAAKKRGATPGSPKGDPAKPDTSPKG